MLTAGPFLFSKILSPMAASHHGDCNKYEKNFPPFFSTFGSLLLRPCQGDLHVRTCRRRFCTCRRFCTFFPTASGSAAFTASATATGRGRGREQEQEALLNNASSSSASSVPILTQLTTTTTTAINNSNNNNNNNNGNDSNDSSNNSNNN
jgi:hypothetical protein